MDDEFNMRTIKIGNDDPNEQSKTIGMSAQGCKSYVFHADENTSIRLIDTPGTGDTREIVQDKKNFESILKYIGQHKHLNGIYFLLKPNNARLNVVFRFCIQELLSHLHRNAKDNVSFCFTNTRSTFYHPGNTINPLKKQFSDLKERSKVEIKINKDTSYCFDNKSVRFLTAIKNGITFTEENQISFAKSWERSVGESLRLLKHLVTRTPYKVKDTLSLNDARNIVILLSKPLAEMGQLIQMNISKIQDQQKEIANSTQTIGQLEDRLYIEQIDLEPMQLGYPRTVCTSHNCVKVLSIGSRKKINYKTNCHERCYLSGVACDMVNNAALQTCSAITNGICQKCLCNWTKHIHITYENKHVTVRVIDQNVEKEIKKKRSFRETKKAVISTYQKRIDDLKKEQQTIAHINVRFAQFLRQSAIAPFNDAYADYLDHFITEENMKKNADPNNYDNRILEGLKSTKKEYMEKIMVIKKAIENDDPSLQPISPDDIANFEQQLYKLSLNGQTLKKIKEQAEFGQNNKFVYEEKHVKPSQRTHGSLLSRIVSLAFN
ncbi:12067_t:CDS:1 [Ambispora leptoticha]|uniref:12067_t:CDS:1 n=1 Tax=Ambispora leptoticha TaxID=144679 RepID=A0A9N9GE65_9GLOM|nr:12067_t:CDS:1 [Ambispora leptoticha]